MDKEENLVMTGKLSVYFEDPFWVGIFEHIQNGKLSVCKVTFGAEPKDYEIQEFVLKHYDKLNFSPAVDSDRPAKEYMNPKRLQRDVKRQLQNVTIGTKSQQALKLQQEQMKTERKAKSRKKSEEELERMFELKQQKKKEKHKGR